MIKNNEKKMSKNRKRRVERKIKVDDKMKLLLHKLNLNRKSNIKTLTKLKNYKLN